MSRWISVIAVVALWALSGCGNDAPQCTPGQSAQCFCATGTGAQSCLADGTFAECVCGMNTANNTTPNNMTPANMTPNNVTTPTNVTPNNMTTPSNNMTTPPKNNVTSPQGTRYCKQSCNIRSDCAVFGDPAFWECNDSSCDITACTTDEACVRQMGNWSPGCSSSGQCGIGFGCVTIEGMNYCAFVPIPDFFECGQLNLDEMIATSVDSGAPTTVCGAPDALCEQSSGNCYRPCATDPDCRPEGENNGLVCMPNGQCGCSENSHCTISGDICVDGECACSNQGVCDVISSMAGIEFVCVP